jgi:hypothetical protein
MPTETRLKNARNQWKLMHPDERVEAIRREIKAVSKERAKLTTALGYLKTALKLAHAAKLRANAGDISIRLQILKLLAQVPQNEMVAEDIATSLGIRWASVRSTISFMRNTDGIYGRELHISRYVEVVNKGGRTIQRAVFALGNREDAKKPPPQNREQRKAVADRRLAKQKERKRERPPNVDQNKPGPRTTYVGELAKLFK